MQIVIKKAAIKGSLFLSYEFEQIDVDVKNTIKTSSDAPIHDDLRNAFRALIPHFTFICEEVKDKKLVKKAIENPELYLSDIDTAPDQTFFKYRVYEFKIIEKDGVEKVSLSGSKRLESHKSINFSTPEISIDNQEYDFIKQLNASVENLKEEVLAYMQGKSAPKVQMDMFGDDEDEEI